MSLPSRRQLVTCSSADSISTSAASRSGGQLLLVRGPVSTVSVLAATTLDVEHWHALRPAHGLCVEQQFLVDGKALRGIGHPARQCARKRGKKQSRAKGATPKTMRIQLILPQQTMLAVSNKHD